MDVLVGQPEMVSDLVDQDVADQFAQGQIAAFGPFVEDRTSIEEDHGGVRRRVQHRAMRQADALIEAGQLEGVLYAQLLQDVLVGEVGDLEDHVADQLAKLVRQRGKGALGQGGEVVQRGRPGAGSVGAATHPA